MQRADKEFIELLIEWRKGLNMADDVAFQPYIEGGRFNGRVPKRLKHAERFTIAFAENLEKTFVLSRMLVGRHNRYLFQDLLRRREKSLAEQYATVLSSKSHLAGSG